MKYEIKIYISNITILIILTKIGYHLIFFIIHELELYEAKRKKHIAKMYCVRSPNIKIIIAYPLYLKVYNPNIKRSIKINEIQINDKIITAAFGIFLAYIVLTLSLFRK